jgi:anti-anti-sigma factor
VNAAWPVRQIIAESTTGIVSPSACDGFNAGAPPPVDVSLHPGSHVMQWKEITARIVDDIVVVDLKGKVCLSGEGQLPEFVRDLLERGYAKFILNFAEVPYIDSASLAGLVRVYVSIARKGGRLALIHIHRRIHTLLDDTKIAAAFAIFDSEEAAIQRLS